MAPGKGGGVTPERKIVLLRAMVSKQAEALDRVETHSGIPWRGTPLGKAAAKLLEETDPEAGEAQAELSEAV